MQKILLNKKSRPQVVDSCVQLIEDEVSKKSGLSGLAIKSGYIVAKNLKNGTLIPEAVDWLLDDFVNELEPAAAVYQKNGGQLGDEDKLAAAFTDNGQNIASALLKVTDARAQKAKNPVLLSAYKKLRPLALREVKAALPGVARIIAQNSAEKK